MKNAFATVGIFALSCGLAVFTAKADVDAQKLNDMIAGSSMVNIYRVNGTLKMDGVVDIKNKKLVLEGVSNITGSGYFTGSEGSVLDVEATSDVSMVEICGGIKLIKHGAGKLSLYEAKETAFAGGIEVFEGILTTAASGNKYLPFGNEPNIVVHQGATLLPHGCYGFLASHTVTLDGGSLGAGLANTYKSQVFQPSIILTADSQYNPAEAMTMGSAIDLGTHTLTVAPTADCKWKPSSIANGTIYLNTKYLKLVNNIGKPNEGNPSANLILGASAKIAGNFVYSVKNLTMAEGAEVEGTLAVYGCFRPEGAANGNVQLQNGATLDLNAQADSWISGNLTFVDAAKITIDVQERELVSDAKIVTWTSVPPNLDGLAFELDATSKAAGFEIERTSDGLMIKKNQQREPYLKAVPNASVGEGEIALKIEGVALKSGMEKLEYVLESRTNGDWQEESRGMLESENDLIIKAQLPKAEREGSAVKYFRVKLNTPENTEN